MSKSELDVYKQRCECLSYKCGVHECAIKQLKAELAKPIKIKLFRICSHCNKEFEVDTSPIVTTGGLLQGRIADFTNCPLCTKRNDIWVRVQALKEVSNEKD